jgi:iron complex outermembrane receptor protein
MRTFKRRGNAVCENHNDVNNSTAINKTKTVYRKNAFFERSALFIAIASICVSAAAQEAGKIEEVRVEGRLVESGTSQVAIDFAEVGTQVQIIDSAEIETGGFTNFGEAAAGLIRGANIGYSPDEGEFTIRLDGGTDRDTLLMVDGVPYFDRSSPLEDLWPATAIDPRVIDSVEVYRGGNSLYFGSNGGLGVVRVNLIEPDPEESGELGFYYGSFKTRETYGNKSIAIAGRKNHIVAVYGRSYETDAHEIFDEEHYTDNIVELGGYHEFPYSYNSIGMKYRWIISEESDTEFTLGAQLATIDFRDSFPWLTVYQPNFTEFPIYNMAFRHSFSDRVRMEIEGHYQEPQLHNTELDPRTCNIPRVGDLTEAAQAEAASRGITSFSTATEFETFADEIGIPAGCVTNPYSGAAPVRGIATSGTDSWLSDENGVPYGTADNPFPIGAPIGYIIQSRASFGDNVPTKGFGSTDQFYSGYRDWGLNGRAYYELSEYVELVGGIQYTAYEDASHDEYGVRDVTLSQTGVYADLRLSVPFLDGLNSSFAFRNDFNSEFDDQDVYKYSLRQNFGNGYYARVSGGTGYSLPKIDEIGAFGANSNINPGLQPQEVDTINAGFGVDGEAFGGTYNIEIGYFDSSIENTFGSGALEDVCIEYGADDSDRTNIIPPDEFCATASSRGLESNETVSFNRLNTQEIEGFTVDIAFDFDKYQLDFSYTAQDSLQENGLYETQALFEGTGAPVFVAAGGGLTTEVTGTPYFIPGEKELIQSSERPEWTATLLLTYTPTDRWTFALNPRFQGPEYAYMRSNGNRLVDENGERIFEPYNFGDYVLVNASIQYLMGDDFQHRFMLRLVNITDEGSHERAGSADRRTSRAAIRGELGRYDEDYYYYYDWNTKPPSAFLQYEYKF